jgi:hypothetical protein
LLFFGFLSHFSPSENERPLRFLPEIALFSNSLVEIMIKTAKNHEKVLKMAFPK